MVWLWMIRMRRFQTGEAKHQRFRRHVIRGKQCARLCYLGPKVLMMLLPALRDEGSAWNHRKNFEARVLRVCLLRWAVQRGWGLLRMRSQEEDVRVRQRV